MDWNERVAIMGCDLKVEVRRGDAVDSNRLAENIIVDGVGGGV